VTKAVWESESVRLGLVDIDEPDSMRALISKYRRELIATEWILPETAPETVFSRQNETAETIPKPPLKLRRNRRETVFLPHK
jgi:hypothetical protein